MKHPILPTLLFLSLIIFTFQSCTNRTQESTEIKTVLENEVAPEIVKEDIKPEKEYKSPINPNENIELGTIYTDTVKFLEFNDGGDYWLFFAEKDESDFSLITTEKYDYIKGDVIEIKWKMDSIRYAGDPEFLNSKEFLISAKKIKSVELVNGSVKFLWRKMLYNEALETEINSIVLNEKYIKTISEPERAALAYAATFIGNECTWDGNANDDRSNLKCKILSALDLGYQCSNQHLGFLNYWFRNNEVILKEFERCPTKPDGATIQSTFDEINIEVFRNKIIVFFKASGINLRASETWNWTETHYFEFIENELILVNKDISPKEFSAIEIGEG